MFADNFKNPLNCVTVLTKNISKHEVVSKQLMYMTYQIDKNVYTACRCTVHPITIFCIAWGQIF